MGDWLDAKATWYGAPYGAGPDDNGGACGFKNVNLPPFSSMTSCGNQPLFKDGKGCGSCYQVRTPLIHYIHCNYTSISELQSLQPAVIKL
jgi:hypothetical protein